MSDSGSQRRDPESFFLPKARTIVSVTVETRAAEGEENFVGDSEIIALGGASNETKDRPLG